MTSFAATDTRRALYYDWESGHWQAGAIDLTHDAAEVRSGTNGFFEPLFDQIDCLHSLARTVADACVPVADAVPDEEAQVFVTTQLADESRALVLFDRYLHEVGDRLPSPEPPRWVAPASTLVGVAASRVHRKPGGSEVGPTLLILELVVQGALVATWQSLLLAGLEGRAEQPGLRDGLRRLSADRERHARFGLELLRELISTGDADPGQMRSRAANEMRPLLAPLRAAHDLWGPWVSPRELVEGAGARLRRLASGLPGNGNGVAGG